MGGLPLALDQAGAYIEETKCNLDEYLHLFKTQRTEFLKRRGDCIITHRDSVATTFSLAFKRVQQISLDAADLLMLCAFLAPNAIPQEIFEQASLGIGKDLESFVSNKLWLNEVIKALLKFSLVRRSTDINKSTITVHRLVQSVIRDEMDEGEQMQWAEITVKAVSNSFPDIGEETWVQCELWLSHALICVSYVQKWNMVFSEAIQLLGQTGHYLRDLAQFEEAEQLLLQALTICKNVCDPRMTAFSQSVLATIYEELGRYEEAESLNKKVLDIYEQQGLELENYIIPSILSNRADLCFRQGKYKEAEVLYERALSTYMQIFGSGNSHTITCMNNLGMLYKVLGKYEKSYNLLREALVSREKLLGIEHPYTAIGLNNLGEILKN